MPFMHIRNKNMLHSHNLAIVLHTEPHKQEKKTPFDPNPLAERSFLTVKNPTTPTPKSCIH